MNNFCSKQEERIHSKNIIDKDVEKTWGSKNKNSMIEMNETIFIKIYWNQTEATDIINIPSDTI